MNARKSVLTIIAWSFYDWANSAFPVVVNTFIFAAYFTKAIAKSPTTGMIEWGNAMGIAGVVVAILSPICGAIADQTGRRKPWIGVFTVIAIIAAFALWFAKPGFEHIYFFLTWVVIGTIAFELATGFYHSTLQYISPTAYIGRISGWSWGWGYIGGIVILVIALYFFVHDPPTWLNTKMAEQIRICGPLVGVWFAVFCLPFFCLVPDRPPVKMSYYKAISQGLSSLVQIFRQVKVYSNIFLFLLARMFYIDGLNTLFAFGGVYAAGTFNMSFDQVILFGIALNIGAGIGAACISWLDDWIGSKPTIIISLIGLILTASIILFLRSVTWFWIFTLILSLFIGPTQAASRAFLSRVAPPEIITEMFGLYMLSGRATSFLGPWLVVLLTDLFGSQRVGLSAISLFFLVGLVLLFKVKDQKRTKTIS